MGNRKRRPVACDGCFGYCCITSMALPVTFVTDEDVTRITAYLDVPEREFRDNYVASTYEGRQLQHWKHQPGPCYFWKLGRCSIQKVKPASCSAAAPMPISGGVTCKMWHKMRALGV